MTDPSDPPEVFEENHGPSLEDLDDEIKNLIGKLDEPSELVDKMAEGVAKDSSPPLQLSPNTDVTPPSLPSVDSLKPSDVRRLDLKPATTKQSEAVEVVPPPEPLVDIKKQFEQMDSVAEEVLQGTRADRQEAQDAINLMRTEIDKAITGGHNPSRMYVDNLVKALEVKTTINMTAVKVLEAKAKLLAATKAGISIQNNTQVNNANVQQGGSDDLVDLLSNPIGPEDEY